MESDASKPAPTPAPHVLQTLDDLGIKNNLNRSHAWGDEDQIMSPIKQRGESRHAEPVDTVEASGSKSARDHKPKAPTRVASAAVIGGTQSGRSTDAGAKVRPPEGIRSARHARHAHHSGARAVARVSSAQHVKRGGAVKSAAGAGSHGNLPSRRRRETAQHKPTDGSALDDASEHSEARSAREPHARPSARRVKAAAVEPTEVADKPRKPHVPRQRGSRKSDAQLVGPYAVGLRKKKGTPVKRPSSREPGDARHGKPTEGEAAGTSSPAAKQHADPESQAGKEHATPRERERARRARLTPDKDDPKDPRHPLRAPADPARRTPREAKGPRAARSRSAARQRAETTTSGSTPPQKGRGRNPRKQGGADAAADAPAGHRERKPRVPMQRSHSQRASGAAGTSDGAQKSPRAGNQSKSSARDVLKDAGRIRSAGAPADPELAEKLDAVRKRRIAAGSEKPSEASATAIRKPKTDNKQQAKPQRKAKTLTPSKGPNLPSRRQRAAEEGKPQLPRFPSLRKQARGKPGVAAQDEVALDGSDTFRALKQEANDAESMLQEIEGEHHAPIESPS